jgi:hypothetical protein
MPDTSWTQRANGRAEDLARGGSQVLANLGGRSGPTLPRGWLLAVRARAAGPDRSHLAVEDLAGDGVEGEAGGAVGQGGEGGPGAVDLGLGDGAGLGQGG